MTPTQDLLLYLLRVAIVNEKGKPVEGVNWNELIELGTRQDVLSVVCDGLQKLHEAGMLKERINMQMIASVLKQERLYLRQEEVMRQLALFYEKHGIRMMVIKGWGLSLNYPKPVHRHGSDIDIYLFGDLKKADELVNKELGIKVDNSHHNHSVFNLEGVTIENHYNFVNIYAHRSSKQVDQWLKENTKDACLQGNIWLPSAQFNALYVLRHAASHFAAQKITLRHVLDWATFVEKHHENVDWDLHWQQCCQLNMQKFLLAINDICVGQLGFSERKFRTGGEAALTQRVFNDILTPEFDEESPKGVLPYIQSRSRRWWANRWKHEIVYKEGMFATLFQQMGAHLRKPASLRKK